MTWRSLRFRLIVGGIAALLLALTLSGAGLKPTFASGGPCKRRNSCLTGQTYLWHRSRKICAKARRGSLGDADPQAGIGHAYVTNQMGTTNRRSAARGATKWFVVDRDLMSAPGACRSAVALSTRPFQQVT
jgi:hypothetical protein